MNIQKKNEEKENVDNNKASDLNYDEIIQQEILMNDPEILKLIDEIILEEMIINDPEITSLIDDIIKEEI